MRRKKEIDDLTASAGAVSFPQPEKFDHIFDRFDSELQKVLDENGLCDSYDLDRKWEFSPENQVYYTRWKRSYNPHDYAVNDEMRIDIRISLTRSAELDPKKPILNEIVRLQAEREQFQEDAATAIRAAITALVQSRK